jgi:heme-degrading monooxygenase HmoA
MSAVEQAQVQTGWQITDFFLAAAAAAKKETGMYARATVIQGRPDTMDEAAKIFSEAVIPAAKQQKGFKGALFLTDPASGKGMSVTLWETEEDLKAGESSGYFKEQVAKFAPLLAGPPTRDVFVVASMV